MSIEHLKCMVLDASYTPVDILSAKDALSVVFKEKAHIIETHENRVVRTVNTEYDIPKQIVLNYIVKKKTRVYNVPAQLNNRNLFIRDNHTCQYCGVEESSLRRERGERLTRDHVLPRDLGGKDVWGNVVTACNKCNNKKANYLLEDTDLILKTKPYAPMVFEIMMKGPMGKRFHIS